MYSFLFKLMTCGEVWRLSRWQRELLNLCPLICKDCYSPVRFLMELTREEQVFDLRLLHSQMMRRVRKSAQGR